MSDISPLHRPSEEATNKPQDPGWYKKNFFQVGSRIDSLLNSNHEAIGYTRKLNGNTVNARTFICDDLFGENASDLMTTEEWDDIKLLFSFLAKRTLNADKQWDSPKKSSTDRLLVHDIVHACCRYMKDPENSSRDLQRFVPTPLKHPNQGYPYKKEALEEELFALLWRKHFHKPYITNGQVGCEQYGEINRFISGYHYFIFECYEVDFDFDRAYDIRLDPDKDRDLAKQKYSKIIGEITNNPHPKLVELLTYIWNNQKNPRVMIDLFFREMQPLIDQIKIRVPYNGERRISLKKSSNTNNPPSS